MAIVTFSNNGARVAEFISSFFNSRLYYFGNDDFKNNDGKFFIKKNSPDRVTDYFKEIYSQSSSIIFISACGIAVRLVAPLFET